jgi:Family of unknown function (DUF5994)
MTLTVDDSRTVFSPSAPSTPRLKLQPPGPAYTLLDGGWWPRSTDPAAELPGLVLAIDALHGPVKRVMLNARDWASRPHRLGVAGRRVRVGYFASQPSSLLTALSGTGGGRVDLLVVPPGTDSRVAAAAMALAATPNNQVHADDILQTTRAHPATITDLPEDTWESEGGHLVSPTAADATGPPRDDRS